MFLWAGGPRILLRMASWPAGNAVTALWRRRAMRRASCARFTFNQPVSALFAESLQWPEISRVDFHTATRTSHGECPVNYSPWREHGHSDVASIERAQIGANLGLPQPCCITRLRPPYSLLRRLREVFRAEKKFENHTIKRTTCCAMHEIAAAAMMLRSSESPRQS